MNDFSDDRRWRPSREDEPTAMLSRDQWKEAEKAALKGFWEHAPLVKLLRDHGLLWRPWFGLEREIAETRVPYEREGSDCKFQLRGLHLPFIHADFDPPLRLAFDHDWPDDWILVEVNGRRCATELEKTILGITGDKDRCRFIPHGMCELPNRIKRPITPGDSLDWHPHQFIEDVEMLKATIVAAGFEGPCVLVVGERWKDRLRRFNQKVNGRVISDCLKSANAELLTSDVVKDCWDMVLFQLTQDVVRLVNLQEPTVIWWKGQMKTILSMTPAFGLEEQFDQHQQERTGNGRIMVATGKCGVVHGSPKE